MFATINLRIKAVLDTVFGGNVTAMAKDTGIKRTTINSVVGSLKTTPGFDIVAKIGEISSPRISMEWLIRGVGEMFLDERDNIRYEINSGSNISNSPVNDSDTLNRLLGLAETKDRQIEEKDKQISALLDMLRNTKIG